MELAAKDVRITNLSHLFPDDFDAGISDEALKLREFLGLIVRTATAGTAETDIASGIRCRNKIKRKKCLGFLLIQRGHIPGPFIHWVCDSPEYSAVSRMCLVAQ